MKKNYITVALLSAGLLTGCINIKVVTEGKHHKAGESEEREEEKEGRHSEGKHHEHEESDEADEHEGKGGEKEGKESDERGEKHEAKESEAKLHAMAKISEADARKTALARVPNGTIKEGELEMENGKLQWSFDMATPGSKDITEVNIDAITGEVISVAKESPAAQAKEKEEDEKKEKN